MKNYISLSIIVIVCCQLSWGQGLVDGSFNWETENNKKYSLYIPSDYDETVPHQLMLGLHPLNPSRWTAQSWRDTLINFAETNSLLLVCPDGGPNGSIVDAIDTSFTSALLDSVSLWYNVDQSSKFIMGFSMGGQATYTYGLRRTAEFRGSIVIGAAVNGLNEVTDIIKNAENENFYLIHGSQDAVSLRYTPILNALKENHACVESRLLPGVGHTIDFPNRNNILSDAFNWIKNNICNFVLSTEDKEINTQFAISPNPSTGYFKIENIQNINLNSLKIIDIAGRLIDFQLNGDQITLNPLSKGIFLLSANEKNGLRIVSKIIVE